MKQFLLCAYLLLGSCSVFAQSSLECFQAFADNCFYNKAAPNYQKLQDNKDCFTETLNCLNTLDRNERLDNDYICHYINLHNFLLVYNITQLYPVVDTRYAQEIYSLQSNVNGELLSPESIKQNQLKEFIQEDPRLLFLLWDGSKSGPEFKFFPLYPIELNPNKRKITEAYLSDSSWVSYKPEELSILVSPYFTRHRTFFLHATGGIINFLNLHKPFGIGNLQMGSLPYDYSLRESKQNKGTKNRKKSLYGSDYKYFMNGMIVPHKQLDVAFWSGLYSENGFLSDFRKSYASQILQLTYGASEENLYNFGLGLTHKSNLFSWNGKLFDIYRQDSSGSAQAKLSSARLFYTRAIKSTESLSLLTDIEFPLSTGLEQDPFLAYQNIFLRQGLFYNKAEHNFNSFINFNTYLALGLKGDELLDAVGAELNIVVNYFFLPRTAMGLYFNSGVRGELGANQDQSSFYVAFGGGLKFLVFERMILELVPGFAIAGTDRFATNLGFGLRKQF